MRAVWLILAASLCLAGAVALNGTAPLGRMAVRIGLPGLAVALIDDPAWDGVVEYRRARYDAAAEAFRAAGSAVTFNQGNALALAGRYREAISAYTAVVTRDPGDAEALHNRALVRALAGGEVGQSLPGDDAQGDGTAPEGSAPNLTQTAGGGEREAGAAELAPPKPRETAWAQERVRQGFHGRRIVATERWLMTLQDHPGRYLKARIAAEHARRVELGIAMPPGEDPW